MKNISFKIASFLGAALMLSACGFAPVYGVSGSGIGPVEIAPIEGRVGHFLSQSLQRRAGLEIDNSEKRNLEVKVTQRYNNVSLKPDSFPSRTRVSFDAEYILKSGNPEREIKGLVTSIASFDSGDQAYSDISLQSDAEERAANDLADRIWADLINKSRNRRNR